MDSPFSMNLFVEQAIPNRRPLTLSKDKLINQEQISNQNREEENDRGKALAQSEDLQDSFF